MVENPFQETLWALESTLRREIFKFKYVLKLQRREANLHYAVNKPLLLSLLFPPAPALMGSETAHPVLDSFILGTFPKSQGEALY